MYFLDVLGPVLNCWKGVYSMNNVILTHKKIHYWKLYCIDMLIIYRSWSNSNQVSLIGTAGTFWRKGY